MNEFLNSIDGTYGRIYSNLFVKEKINLAILAEMNDDQLKSIGLNAFGVRFNIIQSIHKYLKTPNSNPNNKITQKISSSEELNLIKDFQGEHPYLRIAEFKLINIQFNCGEFFNKDLMSILLDIIKSVKLFYLFMIT